ncbi:MAG: BMP family ABC transporter substrate-binding protein [Firmicutes bacterium]|nr:BMP family ABC transporter substrate-binding protein [Bacillota bacterium]
MSSMRKWRRLGAALAAGSLLLLAGCGGSGSSGPSASGSGSQPASGTTSKPFKVALVVNGTLGDKGFFDSAAAGLQRAHDELGVDIKILQADPKNPQEWLQNLQSVSDGSYNLVITGSSQMKDNLTQVAKAAPNQKFVYFDDTVDLPNIANIIYKQNEGSYLAGVLAGLVTTDTKDFPLSKGSKVVGVVGGMDIPVINDFIVGFTQGVHSVDPGIRVLKSYVGDFSNPNKGYDQAKAMYDQGADIVYAVAGGSGLGVLKASADANRYSIGVDSDQNGLYPGHVLASMVKRVDNSLFDMIKAAKDGTLQYGGKVYPYGLTNQGVGLILDTKDVPASVQEQLKAAEQKVAGGQIQVQTVTGAGGQ